jgi:hypothetical protein
VQQADIVAALMSQTGGLAPSQSTTFAELGDLRRALASSVAAGQVPKDIGTPLYPAPADTNLEKELTYLAANPEPPASLVAGPGTSLRVVRRSTPVSPSAISAIASASSSNWTAGLQPSRTFGPFADQFGQPWWFDVFTFSSQLEVRRTVSADDFLILPKGVKVSAIVDRFQIPAGTVWIAASQFSPSAPDASFVGIRVKSGQMTIAGVTGFTDPLIVPLGATVTLTIEPDPLSQAGPASGSGEDATNAAATFPVSATFVFGAAGITSITAGVAAVTAYGSTVHLTRNGTVPSYDAVIGQILVPFDPDLANFNIASVASTAFQPSGAGAITTAAWAFTPTPASTVSAGATAGTGTLALVLQNGVTATWPGLDGGSVSLDQTYLEFDGSQLLLFAPAASGARVGQTFQLWNDSVLQGRCEVDVRYSKAFVLALFSDRHGFDAVLAAGMAQALIDRPMSAGGLRLQPNLPADVILLQSAGETRLSLFSTAQPDQSGQRMSLALSNGLITTSLPDTLVVSGFLASPGTVDQGSLSLLFRPYQLLPALADPYAANFEPLIRDSPVAALQLRVTVTWAEPTTPTLAFAFVPAPTAEQLDELLPQPRNIRDGDTLLELFNQWVGGNAFQQLALLDVSSNADQLGVALGVPHGDTGSYEFTIVDLALTTAGANARTFLLPQFQWEPIYNKFNPQIPSVPEGFLFSKNDGGPTLAGANSVTLMPIAPVSVATEIVNAFAQEQKTASVLFTLPFGIQAVAGFNPANTDYLAQPTLQLIAPDFGALRAARQLRLTAGTKFAHLTDSFFTVIQSYLEGRAQQTSNFAGQNPPDTLGPLGPVITTGASSFDSSFNARVPISQVDLSGYGATTFSRWLDATNPTIGITQVCFDGFNGRTSYYRVEMKSLLWPCLATVVRTITVERYGNGLPIRWDSGWIPTSDGHFIYPGVNKIHTGVVDGFYDIAEISDTDVFITLSSGTPMQAVYYDCNIGMKGVTRGAGTDGRVPAQRQLGFVQYIPADQSTGSVLTDVEVKELFDTPGMLGGSIDCSVLIGSSQHEMRITSVYAANAGANPTSKALEYALPIYGSPVLPAAGHWSVVKAMNTTNTVTTVDSALGIPLIQQDALALRWAEPSQMFSTDPEFDYALLFSSETQKILFPRLQVEPLASDLTSVLPPLIADPYSQLNTSGLFPLLPQAIPFPSASFGLTSAGGLLKLSPDPFTIPVVGRVQSLIDVSSWADNLDYSDAEGTATQFIVNSASNWTVDASPMRQKLRFPLVGDILSIVHQIHSPVDDLTSFTNPGFEFSGLFKPVTDVFDMLEQWVPDLPGPLKVSASFSGATFQLSAVADFQIGDDDGNAIDVGIGKLSGELKAGANLTAELLKQTITGSVFLGITGSYQQEVFPAIYAGGQLSFQVGADQSGKTTLDFDAGTVGSVGGDIIPDVVSLEATVKYGFWMQVVDGNVAPGIDIGMDGRAKLLDGLLGFKLGVEGRALITRLSADPDHFCHLLGSILISGSIQVAWVVDERKSWEAQFDVNVGWQLIGAAAKLGLLPVP